MRAILASGLVVLLLPPMIARVFTTTQPIATTQRVATTLPAQVEITTWSEWPDYGGWCVASLTWSKTGTTQPDRYWLNFEFREYPLWPTAFGVDQDDPTNYVVDSKVVMLLIRDVNRDGRVTTADYSAVKEGLGAVAPNPVDYGG